MMETDAAFVARLKTQASPPTRDDVERLRDLVLRVDWDQIACWATCQDRSQLH